MQHPCCPVCLSEFGVGVARPWDLGCGHNVCESCLATWSGPQSCPIDRSSWVNPHVSYDLIDLLTVVEQLEAGADSGESPDVTHAHGHALQASQDDACLRARIAWLPCHPSATPNARVCLADALRVPNARNPPPIHPRAHRPPPRLLGCSENLGAQGWPAARHEPVPCCLC